MVCAGACWGAEASAQTINYRSIGTAGNYTSPGTVTTTAGSKNVMGTGTTWLTSNRGRGDSVTITGIGTYTIDWVYSDTSLLLTSPATGSVSGANHTIARKFTTIDAWRACIDTTTPCAGVTSQSLVADNRVEVGVLYKESPFTGLGAGLGEITGIGGPGGTYRTLTTDATHYVMLTAVAQNRHNGNPGAGVVIDGQMLGNKAGMIRVWAAYTRIEWVEIKNVTGNTSTAAIKPEGAGANNLLINNVILHHGVNGIRTNSSVGANYTVRNSIIYANTNNGIDPQNTTDNFTIENCTIFGNTNLGISRVGNPMTVQNTISMHNGGLSFAAGIAQSYNISSDATASGPGSLRGQMATDVAGVTLNRVVFQACPTGTGACTAPAGTFNFHLRNSTVNNAVDTGTDLSGSFVKDIDNETRPTGANTWDKGADELSPGGPGGSLVEPVCSASTGSWWNAAWGRRRRIAFDNSGQAENLQDFPVLVKLDSTRINYGLTKGAGEDLRFVDSDDQTVLAHEIEEWNDTGTSYVWVRVPQIDGASNRDHIWMYYDNSFAFDGQNAAAVWDGGFKMVQHLDEIAGSHTDSTSNGNHSVAIDVAAQGTAGHIDRADLFSRASQDNVDVADSPSLDVGASESLTVEAWVKTTLSTTWQMVVDKKNAQGSRFWQVWVDLGNPSFAVGDGPQATDRIWVISSTSVADGAWHYLVGRWNRPTWTGQIFIDGVAAPEIDTNTTIGGFENSSPVMIGQEGDVDGGGNFDGTIDEVRVSKVSRSNDWIRAQYLSMRDAFATYGPELGGCNLRSIGTAGAYGTTQALGNGTTVSVKAGSRTVVGAGAPPPAWKTANRGRGDNINIAGSNYTILSVDSETQLRLTTPYNGGDATGLTYTISRKFGTIDAWRACIDTSAGCGVDPAVPSTNLVADNRGEVGILYKDTPFTGLGAGNGEITGIGGGAPEYKTLTTDPAHFVTLTADGQNRHYGVAGVGAGVVIDGQDQTSKAGMIRIVASHTRIEWVEMKNVCPTGGCSSTAALKIDGSAVGVVIDRVLLHDNINGIVWSSPATTSVTVRNSIIYASTTDGIRPVNDNDTVTIENCTILGKAGGGLGINKFNAPAITAVNTIALHNPGGDFVSGITQSYNRSFDASAIGTGSLTGQTATDVAGATANRVVFVACPAGVGACTAGAGSYNLHLKTSTVNTAVNTGADLSASFVEDVDEQGRPVGAGAWDIGADEQPGQADLTIDKTDGLTSAVPGTPITYTLRVTNNGPTAVTSLVVTDTVPSDILNPTFTPSEGSYYPATGLWTGVSLPANDFVILTLSGTIKPSATSTLSNTATVSAGTGYADVIPGNNTDFDNDTALNPEADLSVAKSAPPGPLAVGTDFSYTVTVTNNGPSDATGVVVTDPIPFEVEFLSSTPSNPPCAYDAMSRTLTCTPPGSLAPNATFVVTIDVKAVAAGAVVNSVAVAGGRPDRVSTNDTARAQTDVFAPGTAVRFLSATATDGKVVLQWLNPDIPGPVPDYSRTEVYVRTDHFTTIPTELGNTLVCNPSNENAKDSCEHNPGAGGNGTTYYYTAFVRMDDNSLSAPRFVRGRPFLTSGRAKFAYSTGAASMASPGVGVEAVHVVSNDNALHSVWKATRPTAAGEWPTLWKPLAMMGPSQGRPTTIPIAIGSHARIVYLGSQDGRVYAIDADTGEEVWSRSLAALWQPGTMVQAQPSGMFQGFGGAHDFILVGTRYTGGNNAFYALDRDDGDPVAGWPFSDGGVDGKIGIVSSQATVDYATRRVYFTSFARSASDNRTVWCLDLDTGAKVWAKPYPSVTTSPTLRGTKLYVGTADGDVLALEAANPPTYGNVVWSFSTGDGPVKGFVMADRVVGQDLYFSTSNRVWALTDTGAAGAEKWGGSPLGSRALPGPSTPILWQDRLHVGGSDGKLYTLRALDGADDQPPLTLGDGSAGIGSPTLDINDSYLYVGNEAGVIHAVQMP